jgi:hypothetical protein
MSIPAVSSAIAAPNTPKPAPKVDSPHDGDSDDAVAKTPVQAAPAAGTGKVVDKKA